jgi:hypothetical protein
MVVWGVVSAEVEQVIEFFGSRHEAVRMLAEVIRDEPDWLEHFRIERIELGSESLNSSKARAREARKERFFRASPFRPAQFRA